MKIINFPESVAVFISSYGASKDVWDKAKDVSFGELHYSEPDLERLVDFVIGNHPELDAFSEALLSEIIDSGKVNESTLKKIWGLESKSCRVSIASRKDISGSFLKAILETDDEDILSHAIFNSLVSVEECLAIQNRNISESLNSAIGRAIRSKKSHED